MTGPKSTVSWASIRVPARAPHASGTKPRQKAQEEFTLEIRGFHNSYGMSDCYNQLTLGLARWSAKRKPPRRAASGLLSKISGKSFCAAHPPGRTGRCPGAETNQALESDLGCSH